MSDPALLEPQTQKGVNVDPPERLAFEERPLKGEPASDRLLETESGRLLRERILVADARAENVVTPADPAATAFSLLISHAAVDADGCYWICGNDAGLVHRFTPAGKLDRSLAVPVKKPAMCAFGGAGLDTLFVTSIRPGGDVDLSDQPLAGSVFALRPGVRGLPEPAFV